MRMNLEERLDYFAGQLLEKSYLDFESNLLLAKYYTHKNDFDQANLYFEKVDENTRNYPKLYLEWEKYEQYFDLVPQWKNDEEYRLFLKHNPEYLKAMKEFNL